MVPAIVFWCVQGLGARRNAHPGLRRPVGSRLAHSLEALSDMPCEFVWEPARPSLCELHSEISERNTLIWTPDAPFEF